MEIYLSLHSHILRSPMWPQKDGKGKNVKKKTRALRGLEEGKIRNGNQKQNNKSHKCNIMG